MPNQFDLLAAQQPSINMLGSRSFADMAPEPDRGIIGTILHELGADILGGGRTVAATGGELLGLLGFAAPITYEDLSTRDIKGAMMLAAMGAGGIAGGIAGKALGTSATVLGRAGTTALSEAVAGAAFGLVQPLDEDDSRLGSIVGNAALGGGIGAGASFIKSGAMAVIGARTGAIKAKAARVAMGQAGLAVENETLMIEIAGLEVRNPISGSRIGIRAHANLNGKTTMTTYTPGIAAVTSVVDDFGQAIVEAQRQGFTESLGVWNPRRALKKMSKSVDQGTLDLLAASGGDIEAAFGAPQLAKYRAVREAASLSIQADQELAALAGEVIMPADWLGTPQLVGSRRKQLVSELGIKAFDDSKMTDGDVLRAAIKKGLVDINNIADGATHNDIAFELFVNDMFPTAMQGADIIVNKHKDALFTSILLPSRIAKFFPEVAPVVKMADDSLRAVEIAMQGKTQWLFDLGQSVGPEKAARAVDIIDASAVDAAGNALDPTMSGVYAQQLAAATNDPEIIHFVNQVVPALSEYLERFQLAGLLEEGRSGYFPIINANKWKLDITDWASSPKMQFAGFHGTKAEALRELEKLRAKAPEITAVIGPQGFTWEKGALIGLEPAQLGKVRKSLIDAYSQVLTPADARKEASAAIEQQFFMKQPAPLKGFANAKQRVLGIRDFAKDPMEALNVYINNAERTLALREFERASTPFIDALPASQPRLKAWGEQFIGDILGKPRSTEQAFDAFMEHAQLDVQPRALRRYLGVIRGWETASRLGGITSAIINLTQIPMNTYPVLGLNYTKRGMGALMDINGSIDTLNNIGVDLGMFVPFTSSASGDFTFAGGPIAAFKEKRFIEAAKRFALGAFHKSEESNRLVTAWGAYHQGKDKGMIGDALKSFVQETLDRTQFNYRMSNTPELLRGPVGGIALQFKSFLINEMDFIASMSKPELARFGAAMTTLGGMSLVLNMPGADLVNLAGLAWSQEKLNETLAIKADQSEAWKLVAFGLPSLMNVNLSDNLGIGTVKTITSGLLGPGPKDMIAFAKFVTQGTMDFTAHGQVADETKRAFYNSVMPSALRRLQRGIEIADTGEVRAPYSGKLVYKPENRLREAWFTAVGAPSIDAAEEFAATTITERVRASHVRAAATYGKQAALAIIDGDIATYQETLAEAAAAGNPISASDVKAWVRRMKQDANSRRRQRTPKELRADMEELYSLTGDPGYSL